MLVDFRCTVKIRCVVDVLLDFFRVHAGVWPGNWTWLIILHCWRYLDCVGRDVCLAGKSISGTGRAGNMSMLFQSKIYSQLETIKL